MDHEIEKKRIDCSIIVPVYCNAGSLEALYSELEKQVITQNPGLRFEVIFVDDGSRDHSYKILQSIKKAHSEIVRLIKFTRNFGQVSAFAAGYRFARGRMLVNISADLQDPPELISEMIRVSEEEGYPVVICTREERDESLFRRLTSLFFYKMIRKLSFSDMPPGGFDYALITRPVRDAILENNESNPFWQGQILWTGFKRKMIPYARRARLSGKSGWTFSKKIKYLIDGVMSYSYLPMRLMSGIGITVSAAGFLYALVILILRLFGRVPVKGWAPIMIMILVLGGLQMLIIGILGEYLWRTLEQVRRRPTYLIESMDDT